MRLVLCFVAHVAVIYYVLAEKGLLAMLCSRLKMIFERLVRFTVLSLNSNCAVYLRRKGSFLFNTRTRCNIYILIIESLSFVHVCISEQFCNLWRWILQNEQL